jgi:1-aminocyclopropane-1-carboxylate deaminase/D-cysteine desulfhydrase-like pyridoxal-dependent ACC family enzyme
MLGSRLGDGAKVPQRNAERYLMLINNTPLEKHALANGREIWVKREDLCCPEPGPSFSKARGVVAHMRNRPEKVIGVLDTLHSKAGWAVSWAGAQMGKEVVDFWPRFKADPREGLPREQQQRAADFGATMVSFQAGRSAILYHTARKWLRDNLPDSYMMPNALKLPESITENAAEARRTAPDLPANSSLVLSVSSGTVAAGVIQGLHEAGRLSDISIILHMGYTRSHEALQRYMEEVSGVYWTKNFHLVDEQYGYADHVENPTPFPCNPYYDLKAWAWLEKMSPYAQQVIGDRPITLWNIGA